MLEIKGSAWACAGGSFDGIRGRKGRPGVMVANYLDLRWFLLVLPVLAVCFLGWVFVSFSRDRTKSRNRHRAAVSRRRDRHGLWE